MKKNQGYVEQQFCTGCGLCKSYFGETKVSLSLDEKGFYLPAFRLTEDEYEELSGFCPADVSPRITQQTWGEYLSAGLGYSADSFVRNRASSGGVISALCIYIIQCGLADGVIQLGDSDDPLKMKSRVSHSSDSIIECAGSRYIAAMPLEYVMDFFKYAPEEKYVIVGRPCDIRAMRAFVDTHKEYQNRVVFMFSFFCAGTPSINASKRMIMQMGADPESIKHISYRGNGWPGFATVKDYSSKTYTMPYEDSWGRILGRDIYRGCRFCYDGIGEAADISCGDAWYLNADGSISFEEHPGRNVVFARTEAGEALLRQAEREGCIVWHQFDISELQKMQPYQYDRKAQLYYKLLAMKTVNRPIPAIEMRELARYGHNIPLNQRAQIYLGTLRRIMQKRI